MKLQSLLLSLASLSLSATTLAAAPTSSDVTVHAPSSIELGQPVEVTLTNNSWFYASQNNSCVIRSIRDSYGSTIYTPFCSSAIQYIAPGESRTGSWNQRNDFGQQVAEGQYQIEVAFSDIYGYQTRTLHVNVVRPTVTGEVILHAPSEVERGTPVEVTLTNGTSDTVTVNGCLIDRVRNQHGATIYAPFCSAVLRDYWPGQSTSGSWNQFDNYGQQVADGTYLIDVSYTDAWGPQSRTLTVNITTGNETHDSSGYYRFGDQNVGGSFSSSAHAKVERSGSDFTVETRGQARADMRLFGTDRELLELDSSASLSSGYWGPQSHTTNILRVAGQSYFAPYGETSFLAGAEYDQHEGDFGYHDYRFGFVEVYVDLYAGISGNAHVSSTTSEWNRQARTTVDLDAKLNVHMNAYFSPYNNYQAPYYVAVGFQNTGTVADANLNMDITADVEDGISGFHSLTLNPVYLLLEATISEWWSGYIHARNVISNWSTATRGHAWNL